MFKSATYTHNMTTHTWLITGGAGYIGSHVADAFLASGKKVVLYDSLGLGLESRVEYLRQKYKLEIPLVRADLRDSTKFDEALATFQPFGIVHTAALKAVAESIEKPDKYFEVNLHATAKMLQIVAAHGIHHFIFSSTAAVYGAPNHLNPVKEDDPKNPISPYGASKFAAEGEVNKFLALPGNHGTSLRFFNVVGTAAPELLDNSLENLVPIVINKLMVDEPPAIYGTNYPTPDGTCIRDYIDVRDVARAHLAVADSKATLPLSMNVGTGRGSSVREVIKLLSSTAGSSGVVATELEPRVGDSAFLCADVSLIKRAIGIESTYTLEESIKSLF